MQIQTTYVIGSLVLFTTLSLIFNQKQNTDLETKLYNEAILAATELGDSYISEITQKAFDESTINTTIDNINLLTSPNLLGSENNEHTENQFDDIDDYHNFTKTDTLNKLGVFSTTVNVIYVSDANLEIKSNTRKYFKNIEIDISNIYMKNSLKLYSLTSY